MVALEQALRQGQTITIPPAGPKEVDAIGDAPALLQTSPTPGGLEHRADHDGFKAVNDDSATMSAMPSWPARRNGFATACAPATGWRGLAVKTLPCYCSILHRTLLQWSRTSSWLRSHSNLRASRPRYRLRLGWPYRALPQPLTTTSCDGRTRPCFRSSGRFGTVFAFLSRSDLTRRRFPTAAANQAHRN